MELSELVFVAFSKYVVALDRSTGTILWEWEAPKGKNYPVLHLDRDCLFVSMMGYTYCLDPYTGRLQWENELPGLGTGVASIATVSGSSDSRRSVAADITARQSAASSSS